MELNTKKTCLWALLFMCVAPFASAALLDDFESYTPGAIKDNASPPWFALPATSTVSVIEADAVTGNLYGKALYSGGMNGMARPLGDLSISNANAATTLFLRMRSEAVTDASFGLGGQAAASSMPWSSFEVQIAYISGTLRARNAGTVVDTEYAITPGTWYNIWAVIDNTTDTYDLYATDNPHASGLTPLATGLVFRNSGGGAQANDLITFQYFNNGSGALHIDDIYITDGVSLTNPAILIPQVVSPVNGETGVLTTLSTLSWTGGLDADNPSQLDPNIIKYYVWTSEDNVSPTDPNLVLQDTQTVSGTDPAASYTLGVQLSYERTYYWQIEQGMDTGSGNVGDPNNILGPVWSFTTVSQTPSDLVGPVDTKLFPTETAQFTVTYTSVNPVTDVTWYRASDDSVVASWPGSSDVAADNTSSTLTIQNVDAGDEDGYYCIVTSTPGGASDPSDTAQLILKKKLAWYQFEQNLNDAVGAHHASLVGPAGGLQYPAPDFPGTPGAIAGQTYAADPNGGVYGLLTTEAYPKAGIGNGLDEGTITFWFKADQADSGYIMGSYNEGDTSALHIGIQTDGAAEKVHINLRNEGGGPATTAGTAKINDNQWHHCALTMTSAGYTLYVDAKEDGGKSAAMTYSAWDYPMTLMARNQRGSINGLFTGMVDDLQILNYTMTQEEIAQTYYDVTGIRSCINSYADKYDIANEATGLVVGEAGFTRDCQVNIADFAAWAAQWLDSGLFPQP